MLILTKHITSIPTLLSVRAQSSLTWTAPPCPAWPPTPWAPASAWSPHPSGLYCYVVYCTQCIVKTYSNLKWIFHYLSPSPAHLANIFIVPAPAQCLQSSVFRDGNQSQLQSLANLILIGADQELENNQTSSRSCSLRGLENEKYFIRKYICKRNSV